MPLPSSALRPLAALWRGLRAVPLLPLLLLLMAGGVFFELAEEVTEGETLDLDRRLLLALRNPADPADPLGPWWLERMVRDITSLGSMAVLTLVSLATLGFLLLQRRRHAALLVAVSVLGGLAASHALKWLIERPRPDLVPHGDEVLTMSFPSGHATMSAVVYLTLGALIASLLKTRRAKGYVLGVALLITALVGASRVYLGVHWPSDVAAGWALGSGWAVLCLTVSTWLQQRGQIETGATGEATER